MIHILVADRISNEGLDILNKAGIEVDIKLGLKPEELESIISGYDALIVRSQTRVTAEVIKAGKKLKVIARAGAGANGARRAQVLARLDPVQGTEAILKARCVG